MPETRKLKIGVTCYASVGGSGILASSLGVALAERGHEVHFISSERPFRLPENQSGIYFHPVAINDYQLFKYPDYTLPLSVKMAEVSRDFGLDVLHVHYAVPHATAAILARSMLPANQQPAIVTTLHGTDTTLIGCDPGYRPAIQYALAQSDAVTVVSQFLRDETRRVLGLNAPIDVIYNFFVPRKPKRSRDEVRRELGLGVEAILLHSSNLRPIKRIDTLLEAVSLVRSNTPFKLIVLAGESFEPYEAVAEQLGISDKVIVCHRVRDVEDYLQLADIALVTSESESFCLSILEAMCFACPAVSTAVGGIPEVVQSGETGCLVPLGDVDGLARNIEELLDHPERRAQLGAAAQRQAQDHFSADRIVPQYESLYMRVLNKKNRLY